MAKIWLERGVKRQLVSLLLFETTLSVNFLSEAFEVSQYYFFENWLMKLKFPYLLKPLGMYHDSTKLLILLPLRAISFGPIKYDTPCNKK